ncbi:sensor histidine kinase [Azohydromonas lata]|uniref:sensor histidine kinase n=1 Tax=Azohydromonas lata TaxID=45677 RepID=UPI0008320E64|nr:ATP-binding protein [Azohydromonas lata]
MEHAEDGPGPQGQHAGEARWRGLFERMGEGFFVAEALRDAAGRMTDFRFVEVNPAFERLTGIPMQHALGRPVREVIPGVPDDLIRTYARVVDSGEPAEFEVHVPALNDRWYEARARALGHGQFCVLFLEITQRKAVELALVRSEARYRTLFESIDEGFCILQVLFDAAGQPHDYRFVEINPAFERHTGMAGALGRTARELIPNLELTWVHTYARVAVSGEPLRFEDHAPSMGRWFDVFAFRIGNPAEHKVALLFSDITQRKQVEQALREADARKDEFLATLAHELRNPLAPISNGLAILRHAEAGSAVGVRARELMERQLAHMVRLVDDLLDVSRVSRGKVELRKAPVALGAVVEAALETSRPLLDAAGHRLELALPAEPVLLDADATRLSQVLSNLLNNAAKYTREGGHVRLAARCLPQRRVSIAVSDNGIGIPPQMLDQVFDLFTQVGAALERSQGGLGIGLSLARRLVEMHGGHISAASDGAGRGSTFTVELPTL